MKWPKKREFVAFYVLSSSFSGSEKEELDLINRLRDDLCISTKTSKRLLRRLVSLGMLEKKREGVFKVLDVGEYLSQVYSEYRKVRCSKLQKSRFRKGSI